MDFEDFEGYKKIPNEKHVRIQEIYEVLEEYRESIGDLSYMPNLDDSDILIDIAGKYNAKIYLTDNDIVIERIIESGHIDDSPNAFENGKSIPLAHADRVIEQIYDLLKDYLADGIIVEPITGIKKVLKLTQCDEVKGFNGIPLGDEFVVSKYNNEQEELYKIKQNTLVKKYVTTNLESKRELFSLGYEKKGSIKFTISKPPFEIIDISYDEDTVKKLLKGQIKGKELKITADYSDNHYLIELDEIVIGAVDCLDALLKRNYRLEIHDLNYTDIVIAVALMADYMSYVEKKGV